MAKKVAPRKRRTREHVIADLSVHHVEGFILHEGHTAQRLDQDYGYDLVIITYDTQGYIEAGALFVQLKAAERLQRVKADYVFDLDIRDYNLWRFENQPVLVVLYDAAKRRAYWLHVQAFFAAASRRPRKGAKTVRVLVPKRQVFNGAAVASVRALKNTILLKAAEPPE